MHDTWLVEESVQMEWRLEQQPTVNDDDDDDDAQVLENKKNS